ncbi:MAG TPA: trigger factor [Candidatus Omnitrophota bacterium]|nr:trigger factor [Candidatus Omnitrophota bacterium]
MKILKNERSGNLVTLEIEIDAADYGKAREDALLDASRQVKMPGFRPGKAPKAMVEKTVDPAYIEERAAQHVISHSYPEIIKQTGIDPVDYPSVEVQPVEADKPFKFQLKVEVFPDVKLGGYKGISIEKKPTAVTEDEVIKVLGNLQDRFAKSVEVTDRGIAEGDNVDCEIAADVEGVEVKRWPRKLQHLPIGAGLISPEFDREITGMKAGESKEFKLSFKADHFVSEVAGKEVSFKVTIEHVHGHELLPLDDDFAKSVSKFGTMAELKEEIKRSLELEKKEEAEADVKNKLIEEVLKGTKFDVPKALVNYEIDLMVDELKGSLAQSNLTLESYLRGIKKNEVEMRDELAAPATQRAKGKVVLKKISEAEGITVTPQDIDSEIRLMAQGMGQPEDEYRGQLGEGGLHYIKDYLLRKKALDHLVDNAKIK